MSKQGRSNRLKKVTETSSTTFFSKTQSTDQPPSLCDRGMTYQSTRIKSKNQSIAILHQVSQTYNTQADPVMKSQPTMKSLVFDKPIHNSKALIRQETKQSLTARNTQTFQSSLDREKSSQLIRSQRSLLHPFQTKQTPKFSIDEYNVFLAPLTKKPDPMLIRQFDSIYKISQGTISNFTIEMEKINENRNNEYACPPDQIKLYIKKIQKQITRIREQASMMITSKTDKERMEEIINALSVECATVKNANLQIISQMMFARIMQVYKSNQIAIVLYKKAKRLADSEQFYNHKMRCYRGLGELFLCLKPHLAQLYLTKFLVSTWKLNSPTQELKAYELLGKYHYYAGNMSKAMTFHDRMMTAECEPPNSGARRLAISKLNNGSLGKTRRKAIISQEEDENMLYNVSSDDEVQEIIFLKDDHQHRIATPVIDLWKRKPKHQKFSLREMPKFDAKNNYRKAQQESSEANHNIRPQKDNFHSMIEMGSDGITVKVAVSRPNLNLGEVKDVVMISHLSPNRALQNYQLSELTKPHTTRQATSGLKPCNDAWEYQKISKLIQKYTTMLGFLLQWLHQQNMKLARGEDVLMQMNQPVAEKYSTRRKGYFLY